MAFSNVITSLEPSATLSIAKKVRELREAGRDVIGLTLGEPDFDTPQHIRDAAKQALDDGYTHYPPVNGYPALREAIVDKLKRDNGLVYSPNQVVVSNGAKQSVYNIVLSLVNPGDEVVLVAPYWVTYAAVVHLAQGTSKVIQTGIESAYKVTPEQLDEALNENTKLFMFNTPSNPTGSMYSKEELDALVEVLERYPNCYIMSDEIYELITYDMEHVSLGTYASIFDRVITVNGFSKGYAMTGWRLGYIAGPTDVVKLTEKLQGQCTSGANAFAQMGAVAALTGTQAPVAEMKAEFRKRRDLMFDQLKAIEGVDVIMPNGAFYFYPDLKNFVGRKTPSGEVLADISSLCLYLIESEGLALVPGNAFGTKTHVRISYAYAQETLNDGVERLGRALASLTPVGASV
ncbi:MAG: pyridoxal phosphate-dependent aminotransferase [Bacteroidota bacterium]